MHASKEISVTTLRQSLSMTQEEFAHAIGVTVSTVNRWENGHVEPSRLARKAMEHLSHRLLLPPAKLDDTGH